jgi:hypothetical protein
MPSFSSTVVWFEHSEVFPSCGEFLSFSILHLGVQCQGLRCPMLLETRRITNEFWYKATPDAISSSYVWWLSFCARRFQKKFVIPHATSIEKCTLCGMHINPFPYNIFHCFQHFPAELSWEDVQKMASSYTSRAGLIRERKRKKVIPCTWWKTWRHCLE